MSLAKYKWKHCHRNDTCDNSSGLKKTSNCHTDYVNSLENNCTNTSAWENTSKQHSFLRITQEWTNVAQIKILTKCLRPLCILSHFTSPSVSSDLFWWPFRKRDGPQNLTRWPPAYKNVNKSNTLYEAWTEQVAKHTQSLVGTFQIFIHTALGNLHRGNSAEPARCLRCWQLDLNILHSWGNEKSMLTDRSFKFLYLLLWNIKNSEKSEYIGL